MINFTLTANNRNWMVYRTIDVKEETRKKLYLEINRILKNIQKQTPSTNDKSEALSTTA